MASIDRQSNRQAQQRAKAAKKAQPKHESESESEGETSSGETAGANEIKLISFGNRYGAPKNADLVISATHFENPSRELRAKMTGLSSRLQSEFYGHPSFDANYATLSDKVMTFLQEQAGKSNRRSLLIAIGCEEGKHRSVAIVEKLSKDIIQRFGIGTDEDVYDSVDITHRDIDHKQKQITQQKQYDKRRQEKRGQRFDDGEDD